MNVLRLTLRQLQIFVAVARRGSTTAASADLALSQSATSAAVNELERLLSLKLFDRAAKRLLLNDNGRALLPRARALLEGAAAIEQMARDDTGQAQSLRIGASSTLGNYLLPGLLSRFYAGRPGDPGSAWQSKLTIGNTSAIASAVANFSLDIGLIEGPCHEAALQVTPWVRDELVIVASPTHPLAATPTASDLPARVPMKALREAVWLLRETGSGTREATDQLLLPRLRSYRRSIELGSSEAIKHAAAQGLGIACLSKWVVMDLVEAGRLACLTTTLPPITRQCHMVVHSKKLMTPALQAFLACLSEALPPMASSTP